MHDVRIASCVDVLDRILADVLIHPWDAARDSAEWRSWLAATGRFGTLAVNNVDPAEAPLLLPTHFTVAGPDDLLLRLARPNPVWPHLQAAAQVRLAVVDDYAYIPSSWRAGPGTPAEHGVPTSYYSAVQFVCRPTVIDDPARRPGRRTPNRWRRRWSRRRR